MNKVTGFILWSSYFIRYVKTLKKYTKQLQSILQIYSLCVCECVWPLTFVLTNDLIYKMFRQFLNRENFLTFSFITTTQIASETKKKPCSTTTCSPQHEAFVVKIQLQHRRRPRWQLQLNSGKRCSETRPQKCVICQNFQNDRKGCWGDMCQTSEQLMFWFLLAAVWDSMEVVGGGEEDRLSGQLLCCT